MRHRLSCRPGFPFGSHNFRKCNIDCLKRDQLFLRHLRQESTGNLVHFCAILGHLHRGCLSSSLSFRPKNWSPASKPILDPAPGQEALGRLSPTDFLTHEESSGPRVPGPPDAKRQLIRGRIRSILPGIVAAVLSRSQNRFGNLPNGISRFQGTLIGRKLGMPHPENQRSLQRGARIQVFVRGRL